MPRSYCFELSSYQAIREILISMIMILCLGLRQLHKSSATRIRMSNHARSKLAAYRVGRRDFLGKRHPPERLDLQFNACGKDERRRSDVLIN